jgi:hypothetical protein
MSLIHTFVRTVLLCGALVQPAWGQVEEAVAERVMRSSGLWEQMAGLGRQVRAGFEQAVGGQPKGPEQALFQRLAAAADAAFSPLAVRLVARREIAAQLDAKQVPPLLAWTESAPGRRVTALEVATATTTDDPQELIRAGQQLMDAASPARKRLLADLLEASRTTEFAARVTINMGLTLASSLAQITGRADAAALDQLRRNADAQRPALQAQLLPLLTALSAHTYRDLTDADLEGYLNVLKSPHGRHLTDVVLQAMDRVFVEGTEEMVRRGTGT